MGYRLQKELGNRHYSVIEMRPNGKVRNHHRNNINTNYRSAEIQITGLKKYKLNIYKYTIAQKKNKL